jgi:DNA-binding GntR family transcriptional regulator
MLLPAMLLPVRDAVYIGPMAQGATTFRHKIIAGQLMADIRKGVYPVGGLLPPELDLCARFEASRHTVRQALRTLTDRGLIVRRASTGSVVVAKIEPAIFVQPADAMAATMSGRSDVVRTVVGHQSLIATRKLAGLLGCAPGTPWFRIDAVSRSQGETAPLSSAELYVMPAYGGILDRVTQSRTRISDAILELYDEVIERVQVEVFAGPMPASFARRLKKRAGSPCLTVIRRYTGRAEAMFEVSVTVYPAEQHVYLMELRRQKNTTWASG